MPGTADVEVLADVVVLAGVEVLTSVVVLTAVVVLAGVDVLVIGGGSAEALIKCESEFENGNATKGETYLERPSRPRTTACVEKCILILRFEGS